jgi:hypothetical protein
MKVKSFCIIFVLFSLISCKTNYVRIGDKDANYIPYYLKVYEADSLFLSGNYFHSYSILDSLFKKYEPLNMTLYFEYENYLKSAVILKKINKVKFKKIILNYGYNYSNLKKDSLLNIALVNSNFNEKKIKRFHESYVKKLDTVFRKKLGNMNAEDQRVRNMKPYDKNIVSITDSIHNSIFKEYILSVGFPSDKKIGTFRKLSSNDNNNFSLDLFFNHMSYGGDYEFFKEKLFFFVKNGTCSPRIYAMMVDRWHIDKTNKSFYHILSLDENWKMDEEFVKKINYRRFQIGLPSVEYQDFWYKKRILNY